MELPCPTAPASSDLLTGTRLAPKSHAGSLFSVHQRGVLIGGEQADTESFASLVLLGMSPTGLAWRCSSFARRSNPTDDSCGIRFPRAGPPWAHVVGEVDSLAILLQPQLYHLKQS